MQSYNYLSNELPRELIEAYNDVQIELLREIVKELRKNTKPENVYQKLQDIMDKHKGNIEKVVAVIFADSKRKTVKDNDKIFDEEYAKPLTQNEANAVIMPALTGAMSLISALNTKIVANSVNTYSVNYSYINAPTTSYTAGTDKLKVVFKNLAKRGITIYEAFGGGQSRNYSIENVLRRDVMSMVNKANAEIDMDNFKKSSAKFIEVSSHPTARTWSKYMKNAYEDHSSWQGKCYYSREGDVVDGYDEFESTCGYGEMLGIRGINCYHTFTMNYTGEPSATQYDKEKVEKEYALSQQQRQYERAIRQLKSARAVYEEAGDTKLVTSISKNITDATRHLKHFCETNNLKYYNWRTQI